MQQLGTGCCQPMRGSPGELVWSQDCRHELGPEIGHADYAALSSTSTCKWALQNARRKKSGNQFRDKLKLEQSHPILEGSHILPIQSISTSRPTILHSSAPSGPHTAPPIKLRHFKPSHQRTAGFSYRSNAHRIVPDPDSHAKCPLGSLPRNSSCEHSSTPQPCRILRQRVREKARQRPSLPSSPLPAHNLRRTSQYRNFNV